MIRADDRQSLGIQQADLDEQRGLVSIDVFMGNLPLLERHDHDDGERGLLAGRRHAGQHERQAHVMGERRPRCGVALLFAPDARNPLEARPTYPS